MNRGKAVPHERPKPDTNFLVSAIVFGGKPREVLQAAISGRIKLVLSEILLEELKGVLEGPKFRYPMQVVLKILEELKWVAEVVRKKTGGRPPFH